MIKDRASVDVTPYYHHFALCDWFVELDVEATHHLMQTALSRVAASDGRQLIVSSESTRPVAVQLELLPHDDHASPDTMAGQWDDSVVLESMSDRGALLRSA